MIKFKRCYSGLYYYDTENQVKYELSVDFSFVQTSEENENGISQVGLDRIKLARYYQEIFSWTSMEDMVDIIVNEQVKNAEINSGNLMITEQVISKETTYIKVNIRRRTPKKHKTRVQGKFPDNLMEKQIELYTYVFMDYKCSFLITKSGSKLDHVKSKYLKNKRCRIVEYYTR